MNVCADHVVSSYSDAVSLLARHSAPLRSSSTSAGPSPPNVSTSITHQDHAQAHRLRARVVAILRRDVARGSARVVIPGWIQGPPTNICFRQCALPPVFCRPAVLDED
eukprot:scaffold40498_cov73-Phaeocystis_antarctica.AAC.3